MSDDDAVPFGGFGPRRPRQPRTGPTDYAKRIYYLIVGLLIATALTCLIVFGIVLPTKHKNDRIRDNSARIAHCMFAATQGDDC